MDYEIGSDIMTLIDYVEIDRINNKLEIHNVFHQRHFSYPCNYQEKYIREYKENTKKSSSTAHALHIFFIPAHANTSL